MQGAVFWRYPSGDTILYHTLIGTLPGWWAISRHCRLDTGSVHIGGCCWGYLRCWIFQPFIGYWVWSTIWGFSSWVVWTTRNSCHPCPVKDNLGYPLSRYWGYYRWNRWIICYQLIQAEIKCIRHRTPRIYQGPWCLAVPPTCLCPDCCLRRRSWRLCGPHPLPEPYQVILSSSVRNGCSCNI